ncbi:unnamed protein product, partial [Ascophyllum nodosum]
ALKGQSGHAPQLEVCDYALCILTAHTPCHRLPRHLLPPRPPLRDLGLPLLEPPLPAWPRNPDTLRGLPLLWPRPLSGRFPAPALIAPTAYARTPLCLRGPVWATLTDPRHP